MFSKLFPNSISNFCYPLNFSSWGSEILLVDLMCTFFAGTLFIVLLLEYIIRVFYKDYNQHVSHLKKIFSSFLDIIFILIPTIMVTIILLCGVGFIYSGETAFNLFSKEYTALVGPTNESFVSTCCFITAHQWYWEFEWSYYLNLYQINPEEKRLEGYSSAINTDCVRDEPLRLFTSSTIVVVPKNVCLSFFLTSDDVIHSFALPSLGIKMDAIPGREQKIFICTDVYTTAHGMCSELCGPDHAYMPITIQFIDVYDWILYLLYTSSN